MMKRRRTKKTVSLLLVILLLAGVWQPAGSVHVSAAEESFAGAELLVHYEFMDGGKDSSGNGLDAVIGEGVTVENGVASLPGGAADGSGFITLPKGMFDGQDTLTISMWIRDYDPQEEWLGAFFFGSPKNSYGYPTNYFYFVPCEKQHNTLKCVITNAVNESQPYNAEKGIRESVATLAYQGVWTHYAVVLKPGTMTCYIDGEEAARTSLDRTVSDFGTGLESYIGKSNYDDPLYEGDFKDFRVYKGELGETQIRQLAGTQEDGAQYSMEIDGKRVEKQLSDKLYGLFYEDINSAADGGLYPEMVKNYSFENAYVQPGDTNSSYFKENGYQTVANYKLHWAASPAANFTVEGDAGLNENNPNYAVLTGNVTLQNGGFAPQNDPNSASMPVKPVHAQKQEGSYTFSVYAKADAGYGGKLKVKLADGSGRALTNEVEIAPKADGNWNKISGELISVVTANTKGKLVLSVEGAEAADKLCLDMVSVVPHDTYGYGDRNYAYGVGIRKDLLDLMMDLNPKFMRFPGGCIVEGFNWEGIYDWRDTIGPLEERKSNTNRWENWGNNNRTWGYMQSFGFGYHEILSLCEDFGMEAFPILSAGVLCQYETSGVDAKTGEDLQWFAKMAMDLLDYCWGDPKDNVWAAKRAENGHPEPFDLKYLGIGNENLQAKYFNNLDVLKAAVLDYAKTYYPDRSLQIISSAGPTSGGDDLEYAYDRLAQTMPGETLVDEHYYESESFMYNQSDRYDYYSRPDQGGSNVFVGEYAVKNDNKYNTALAEACFITGLERNADLVTNISYAPLLYKAGSLNWSHDLIYFDEFYTAKSTNYYVQEMFANNYGPTLLETELEAEGEDYSYYGSPILGMESASGYIDKVTVYREDGSILLEEDFNDNSNGWMQFGTKGSANNFIISGGRLVFSGTSGSNLVYLPKAIQEKWTGFRIEVEGAVKGGGSGGFAIGAGCARQYFLYQMGKNGGGTVMEVTRPERNKKALTTKTLGNHFANKKYNTNALTRIRLNDPMQVTFNFGAGKKLEAGYTSEKVSKAETAKYNFSSTLHQYQTDIYQVVNRDDENVYIKLVNPDKKKKSVRLNFKNLVMPSNNQAEITVLTGGLNDANAIGDEKIAPQTSMQIIQDQSLLCQLAPYSVNVIRVPLAPAADKTALSEAIEAATELVQEAYTLESWANLQETLIKAERIYAEEAVTQEQVDRALDELNAAILALQPVVIPADRTALLTAIQTASEKVQKDYTPESWSNLQEALTKAKQIYTEGSVTQEQVDDAASELNAAIFALEPAVIPADKTALAAAIQTASEKSEKDYTPESWNRMQEALAEARRVYAEESATGEQVDDASDELNAAILALEPAVIPTDKTALAAAIQTASEKLEKDYTPESWNHMQKALTEARRVYAEESATQEQVDDASGELQAAISALKPAVIPADKTALAAAIQKAAEKLQEDYTSESWSVLQGVLADAKQIFADEFAAQEQVNDSVTRLNAAITALQVRPQQQPPQPQAQQPGIPASVTAAWAGGKNIRLTWDAAEYASAYEIYRSYQKTSGFQKIADVAETIYTDKTAKAGKNVYYKVVSVNGTKKSAYSQNAITYMVAAPSGVKAKGKGSTITLSFKKSAKASGYEIYRSAKRNGKYKKAATLKSGKKIKKIFKKMKKGTYFFKVRAYQKVNGKKVYTGYSKVVRGVSK